MLWVCVTALVLFFTPVAKANSRVCNLQIAGEESYAVGQGHVAVHNTSDTPSAKVVRYLTLRQAAGAALSDLGSAEGTAIPGEKKKDLTFLGASLKPPTMSSPPSQYSADDIPHLETRARTAVGSYMKAEQSIESASVDEQEIYTRARSLGRLISIAGRAKDRKMMSSELIRGVAEIIRKEFIALENAAPERTDKVVVTQLRVLAGQMWALPSSGMIDFVRSQGFFAPSVMQDLLKGDVTSPIAHQQRRDVVWMAFGRQIDSLETQFSSRHQTRAQKKPKPNS